MPYTRDSLDAGEVDSENTETLPAGCNLPHFGRGKENNSFRVIEGRASPLLETSL